MMLQNEKRIFKILLSIIPTIVSIICINFQKLFQKRQHSHQIVCMVPMNTTYGGSQFIYGICSDSGALIGLPYYHPLRFVKQINNVQYKPTSAPSFAPNDLNKNMYWITFEHNNPLDVKKACNVLRLD